jgi:hypothetical protein
VACRDEDTPPDSEPLLQPVMAAGRRVEAQLSRPIRSLRRGDASNSTWQPRHLPAGASANPWSARLGDPRR